VTTKKGQELCLSISRQHITLYGGIVA